MKRRALPPRRQEVEELDFERRRPREFLPMEPDDDPDDPEPPEAPHRVVRPRDD